MIIGTGLARLSKSQYKVIMPTRQFHYVDMHMQPPVSEFLTVSLFPFSANSLAVLINSQFDYVMKLA